MNNTLVGIVLLVVGAVLLFFGFNANGSFTSEMSKFFQGAPSDKSIWLVVAGALAAVLGVAQLMRGRRTA
jgi:uncharacterized protein DUF3185